MKIISVVFIQTGTYIYVWLIYTLVKCHINSLVFMVAA